MKDKTNNDKDWIEYFRLITPFLIVVLGFYINMVRGDIKELDGKLFKHLTDDAMHTPKEMIVTKPEFLLYQQMREKEISGLKDNVLEIKTMMTAHSLKTDEKKYK